MNPSVLVRQPPSGGSFTCSNWEVVNHWHLGGRVHRGYLTSEGHTRQLLKIKNYLAPNPSSATLRNPGLTQSWDFVCLPQEVPMSQANTVTREALPCSGAAGDRNHCW